MKVLLIAPNVGGFYQDIIDELQRRGYETDYVWDAVDKDDPDFVHSSHFGEGEAQKNKVLAKAKVYWQELLCQPQYDKVYDLLFVVDGKMLHPYLFNTLKGRNPKIRMINYLYDTTRGNYRFNVNSKYFDRVVTYDRQDSNEFGWDFIPIPWIEIEHTNVKNYDFFAMGSYIPSRFALFEMIDQISKEKGYKSFVKLYALPVKLYPLKYLASLVVTKKHYLKPSVYYSHFITHSFIPKDIFQKAMLESEVIVDSINPNQDGLTARCTWALGAGKKVITNNVSIKLYDFFTPEQILVVEDDDHSEAVKDSIVKFLQREYNPTDDIKAKINSFRMDNWMTFMLG